MCLDHMSYANSGVESTPESLSLLGFIRDSRNSWELVREDIGGIREEIIGRSREGN